LNILFIAPTPIFADRGCHIRIIEEAKALNKLGNKVTICTYPHGRDVIGLDIKRTIKIPWYNKLEAGPSYTKILLDFLLFLKISRLVKAKRFDIVHAHLHEGALLAEFVNKFNSGKIPVVFDVQGSLTKEVIEHKFTRKNSLIYRILYRIEQHVNKVSDAIIVSSTSMADILKKEYNHDYKKIEVIHDAVNTDFFKPRLKNTKLVKKLSLENKKVVVYTGLLNEYQGIDLLLKTVKEISRNRRDVHFLIIGYPNEEYYTGKADELRIKEFVTFTGKIAYSKIFEYLSLADVAVSPKLPRAGEANLKLYTYMATGLPIVVFDHDVNREILGDLGIYARYADYKSLALKIEDLLDNDGLRNELKEKLRENALEHSWEESAMDIVKIYKKLLQK
jgi:glycosyltransferase involved in cell wall biosynthesis